MADENAPKIETVNPPRSSITFEKTYTKESD